MYRVDSILERTRPGPEHGVPFTFGHQLPSNLSGKFPDGFEHLNTPLIKFSLQQGNLAIGEAKNILGKSKAEDGLAVLPARRFLRQDGRLHQEIFALIN